MENRPTKQVIIVRKDLKIRRGKEISQGSHSALSFLTKQIQQQLMGKKTESTFIVELTEAMKEWVLNSYKKITLQVNSEAELLEVYEKAKGLGLDAHLVTDIGLTEFHGVPTNTCVAIGPDYSDKIDEITGHLTPY